MKTINLVFALLIPGLMIVASCNEINTKNDEVTNSRSDDKAAMNEMAKRLFGNQSNNFVFIQIDSDNGNDVFEIESDRKKIVIKGNNGISMARGLNWYIKYYCHQNVSWSDTKIQLDKKLPKIPQRVRKTCWAHDRYFLNYCSFGYSMVWWDWEQWEMLIDWMALNGINLPLSVTGQEAVWERVCQKMDMTEEEIQNFFTGPPYLPFSWMGCLDSYGGPLPDGWIERHKKLQLKILERERQLGMRPVLQGFTGHVPEAIIINYPDAKSHTIHWGEWETHLLDPNDPLFQKIAALYMKEQIELFGTDNIYAADAFIEMTPPSGDLDYLAELSKAIYNGMSQVDHEAVWVFQSWPFMNRSEFWSQERVQAFLNAIEDDNMIVLDLWCENIPVWEKTHAFYGKPWIWCNIQNFGNKTFMGGNLDLICHDLQEVQSSPESQKLTGAGFVNEGLGYNPVVFDLLFELIWSEKVVLDDWVKDYANHRYGQINEDAEEAWGIILKALYSKENSNPSPYPLLRGKPSLSYITNQAFNNRDLVDAWRLLQNQSGDLDENDSYLYDLVNLARQCLMNHAQKLYQDLINAYEINDREEFELRTVSFMNLMIDMDSLLLTRKEFLLGAWLEDAKRWGNTAKDKEGLEWNARRFITLWGETSWIDDYAAKEWSGMLNDFYAVRWQKYFDALKSNFENHSEFDHKSVTEDIFKWEYNWASQQKQYPSQPVGNSIAIAGYLLEKYFD